MSENCLFTSERCGERVEKRRTKEFCKENGRHQAHWREGFVEERDGTSG